MGSLVLDLQADALNSSISTLDLLRKALLVSKKLGIKDFQHWIKLELHGYNDQPVPEYRATRGQLRAWNPYHGWQPIIATDQEMQEFYESVCNFSIKQPISELVYLLNGENELTMRLPYKAESFLISSVETNIKITISRTSVQGIVETVRNKILDWAFKLEEDGIIGEGMTFSLQEKQIAARYNSNPTQNINITVKQMQNSSESSYNSETFKQDLRGANVANFANQVQDNAQQVASNFSQNIGQNIDEITKLINSLREKAQILPQEQREEALVHLDDLQEDITTPEKQKPQRIKARIGSLLAIAAFVGATVAGTADFANNVLELSQKLGISIDPNIPQLVQHLPLSNPDRP